MVGVLRIEDTYRHPWVPAQVPLLEAAYRSIEDDVVAVHIDPHNGAVRRTVGPQRRHPGEQWFAQ